MDGVKLGRLGAAALSALLLLSPIAEAAGFVEVGGSVNYRRSAFDSENYQELISYTASVAYYFLEMSALELSYTNGYSDVSVKAPDDPLDPREELFTNFQLAALDLVFSFAEREDSFQPYVKIGGGYLKKEVYQQMNGGDIFLVTRQEGAVPSGGIGFRLMLTHSFAIKVGVDAWTTPPTEQPVTVDYAGSLGVSWLF